MEAGEQGGREAGEQRRRGEISLFFLNCCLWLLSDLPRAKSNGVEVLPPAYRLFPMSFKYLIVDKLALNAGDDVVDQNRLLLLLVTNVESHEDLC